MKILPLYYEWMQTGEIPASGLCEIFEDSPVAELFELFSEGQLDYGYWGYDGRLRACSNEYGKINPLTVFYKFTPLRQNIVLLMAAMNGEL